MATECVGKVKNISLKFHWEIDNFCIGCKNPGDSLKSPTFSADCASKNTQWYLRLYPKGTDEKPESRPFKDKFNVEFFLYANQETKAKATLKVLTDSRKPVLEKIIDEYIMYVKDTGYGFTVSRDSIVNPSNDILNYDKMIIECEITYTDHEIMYNEAEDQEIKENKKLDLLIPRIEDEYEALLDDGKFSDISLIAEGKTMKVHKCILAKSSSVFAAMFDAEMKEKQENIVEIADVQYDVLVEMIRFIYAGKVNNIDALVGELAVAADKYALDGLKYTCEKAMKKILSLDNVIEFLKIADRLCMDTLKEKAIKFMIENASDVSDKPEFDSLPHDILRKVFRCLPKKEK